MIPVTARFEQGPVRAWMRRNVEAYVVDGRTGEVNLTELAEGAAQAFDANELGGALDDQDHWIWDLTLRVGMERDRAR